MRGVWTIAAREVASLFRLPVGWIVVALYTLLAAVVFVQYTLIPAAPATMRYFFSAAAWMMIPVAPAISMRLFSEEARTGTIEMLRTAPVGDFAVALGKMLGAWLFLAITIAPTLVLPLTLALVSSPLPDPGPILLGYLVLILFGGLCLGVGLLISALTSSQTLSFLGTLVVLVLLMMVSRAGLPRFLGPVLVDLLGAFSLSERIAELSKGVLDTAAVAFFLIGTAWAVVLTAGVLESRRLSRPRPIAAGLWAAFIAATGASAILAGVLASHTRVRADLTATGAHRLSPRAERLVDLVDQPTEIVFAIDHARADRLAVDLVTDVLRAYERSNPQITLRSIDLSSTRGLAETDALLEVTARRESERAARAEDTLRASLQSTATLTTELELLAGELDAVRAAITGQDQPSANNRAFFEQRAGLARVAARNLTDQSDGVLRSLETPDGPAGLISSDRLAPALALTWRAQREQLTDLADQVSAFATSPLATPNSAALAHAAANRASRARDLAAVTQERLERVPRLDTLRVARALESGEALLVIGPPEQGVAAVDLDTLLPSTEVLEQLGVSPAGFIGPKAQELIATALGQLVRPDRPVVVFTHAGRPGELLGGSANYFTKVVERLAAKGIDSLEWAAAESPEPPDLTALDPTGRRPVVYLSVAADSTAGTGEGQLNGAERSRQLAAALQRLIDAGKPVLISLNPSIFPTYGDTDPMATLAAPFGIQARTGLTLLRDKPTPGGREADPFTTVVSAEKDHPIAGTIRGLRTMLPWAVPMDLSPAPDATAWPLLVHADADAGAAWAESRWLRLWSTPANNRNLLRDQPVFDTGDAREPSWTLAAAAQRTTRFGTTRVLVVGSNGWATDGIVIGTEQLVDGRVTTRFPGNGALLDAAILWLAGQDDLIAPGADARPVATIKPLSAGQLATLRWVLLGLIPAAILIAGAGVRAAFG